MLKVANSVINVNQITGTLPVANGGTGVTTSTGTGNTVLSAAPTLSGDVTLSTGNLIPGTAAKGINFTANTPQAGMTSQLLNWYEEGTWTPSQGGGLVVVGAFSSSGKYTRIGRQVTLIGQVNGATSIAIAAGATFTTNAPFTSTNTPLGIFVNGAQTVSSSCLMASTTIYAVEAVAAGPSIYFEITYFI